MDASYGYGKNSSFDPFTQSFVVLMPDGKTPLTTDMTVVDTVRTSAVQQSIIQAVQFGLCTMLLLILLIMTKREKRKSRVFFVNALALVLVCMRSITAFVTFSGPYYTYYRWLTHYYADMGDAAKVSAFGEVLTVFLTIVTEYALILQVNIMCCTLTSSQKWVVNGINTFGAVVACSCHLALAVINIRWSIFGALKETEHQFYLVSNVAKVTNIAVTISIGISSLLFCTKLGLAIRSRRSIGIKDFGPMQIIFIGGCQTMLLPFLFTLVSYFAVPYAQIQSFVQSSVAILLPLSGMWASQEFTQVNIAKPDRTITRTIPSISSAVSSGGAYGPKVIKSCSDRTCSTYVGEEGEEVSMVAAQLARAKPRYDDIDLEMQSLGAVDADRTLSVRSD